MQTWFGHTKISHFKDLKFGFGGMRNVFGHTKKSYCLDLKF